MFGFFKGLFGNSKTNQVVEAAFEAAILDELEEETAVSKVEPVLIGVKVSKDHFQSVVGTIQKICCGLEKSAGAQEILGVEGLLPSFYTCLLYDVIVQARCAKKEKFDALNELLDLCPASLGMSGQEVFDHIERNDDAGQLIMAMKNFPLVVLDLAHKTGHQSEGRAFLNALAAVFLSVGEICEYKYPGKGFLVEARKIGTEWMDRLNHQIMG